jgi:low temperature requirement protein LtrA
MDSAMAAGVRAGLLRDRHGPQRVTFLELFFDLVYVFAVTQLSHTLLEHLELVRRVRDAHFDVGGLGGVELHGLDHELV